MVLQIDLFRTVRSAGRDVVVGLTWDVLVVFALLATLTFLVHYVLRELWNPTDHSEDRTEPSKAEIRESLENQGIEEVDRFSMAQRASHWIMAISVFALMVSGFIIMNSQVTVRAFLGISWLNVHIVSSLVLIGYVGFHLGHVAYKGTWSEMWFGRRDARDLWVRFRNLLNLTEDYPRQFKYPSAQKLLHWGVTGATLGLILTGLVLLRRVSLQPLWSATREFSVLGIRFGLGTGDAMGLVSWSFVLHDFLAIATVSLVMGHIYFALRPNEWAITRSMITGTVDVDHYAEKYSPASWAVGGRATPDGGELGEDEDPESVDD